MAKLRGSDDEMNLLQRCDGDDDNDDDYNNPDSLLNRSGYLNAVFTPPQHKRQPGKLGLHLALGRGQEKDQSSDEESMLDVLNKAKEKKLLAEKKAAAEKAAEDALARASIVSVEPEPARARVIPQPSFEDIKADVLADDDVGESSDGPPAQLSKIKALTASRARPITSPHIPLSVENLMEAQKYLVHEIPAERSAHNKVPRGAGRNDNLNWGDMDFDSEDNDGDSDDSGQSYGASMYKDTHVFQELDRYRQMPRRRDSLDKTIVDMGTLLQDRYKNKKLSNKKLPDFKPAAGCTTAADYILRPFCARMRKGLTVIKHNKSRWSKSSKRVLVIREDGKTLTWKPCEGDPIDSSKGKRPKLDLSKCREVRHAYEPDPESRIKTGTTTIRAKCTKEAVASKSFSLVFSKRTLDLTAASSDQCKLLMEGFSALCFRLQVERQQAAADDPNYDSDVGNCAHGSFTTDNDWASTVYGGETTASMTQSTTSRKQPSVPTESRWGL
jgi:hypothetical protein